MAFETCEADLLRDEAALIEFLRKNLTPFSTVVRFEWLYRNNPAGPAQVWMLRETKSRRLAGVGAAFPRTLQIEGKAYRCLVLGDFCLEEDCRTLGPALLLQRACLSSVDSGEFPLSYDFPSQSMMAIYKRLRIPPLGAFVRFAKPLRADRQVESLLGRTLWSRRVSAVVNRTMAWTAPKVSQDFEVRVDRSEFGEDFRALGQREGLLISGERTPEFLNWRFHNNPLFNYEIVTLRQSGKLQGFAVFREEDSRLVVTDVSWIGGPETADVLLGAVEEVGRQRQLQALVAHALEDGTLNKCLVRAGFTARESCPMVTYMSPISDIGYLVSNVRNWVVTSADRDS